MKTKVNITLHLHFAGSYTMWTFCSNLKYSAFVESVVDSAILWKNLCLFSCHLSHGARRISCGHSAPPAVLLKSLLPGSSLLLVCLIISKMTPLHSLASLQMSRRFNFCLKAEILWEVLLWGTWRIGCCQGNIGTFSIIGLEKSAQNLPSLYSGHRSLGHSCHTGLPTLLPKMRWDWFCPQWTPNTLCENKNPQAREYLQRSCLYLL